MLKRICLLFLAIVRHWIAALGARFRPVAIRRRSQKPETRTSSRAWKCRRKPPWVPRQVIRLAALMPDAGCRRIADTFNQLWEEKHGETVSKSFVYLRLKESKAEIRDLRRQLKHRPPAPLPKNVVWGIDLTFIDSRPILGILDHGTRANLALLPLHTKVTVQILRVLLDAIENFGLPKHVRTDNEACFTSRLFRSFLRILGIKHQRMDRCAPWQNGRIERFFGTLKPLIRRHLTSIDGEDLNTSLCDFRRWYNHARTHQRLDGRSPAEAWDGRQRSSKDEAVYFSAWEGLLTGFFVPK